MMKKTEEKKSSSLVLNYRYRLKPTGPQCDAMRVPMRDGTTQSNKAASRVHWLKKSLKCGNFEHVFQQMATCVKAYDDVHRVKKNAALAWIMRTDPRTANFFIDFNLPDSFWRPEYVDLAVFAAVVKPLYLEDNRVYKEEHAPALAIREKEQAAWDKEDEGTRSKKRPAKLNAPKSVYFWGIQSAMKIHCGMFAFDFMNQHYPKPKSLRFSPIRRSVSGDKSGGQYEQSCFPSPKQRAQGATGFPSRKRKLKKAYSWQTPLPRTKTKRDGVDHVIDDKRRVRIAGLPLGMEYVHVRWHRKLPDSTEIRRVGVIEEIDGNFDVLLTIAVSQEDYALEQKYPGTEVGVDPGAITALTAVFEDVGAGLEWSRLWDCRPAEKLASRKANIQRQMATLRKPDRKKGIKPSRRWKEYRDRVRKIDLQIRNQRKDAHHKAARELTQCGMVAMGDWEPPKVVKGRKDFKAGKTKEVKGVRGDRRRRREARDRGNAAVRELVKEKGKRSGTIVYDIDEAGTTYTCHCCGAETGPRGKKGLRVREWTCSVCGTAHMRDVNSCWCILYKARGTFESLVSGQPKPQLSAPKLANNGQQNNPENPRDEAQVQNIEVAHTVQGRDREFSMRTDRKPRDIEHTAVLPPEPGDTPWPRHYRCLVYVQDEIGLIPAGAIGLLDVAIDRFDRLVGFST